MKKTDVTKFIRNVQKSVSKHSPEILTGFGIAGMITTTVLAVKATPKALKLIESEKRRLNNELREEAKEKGVTKVNQIDKLTPLETVKVTWKCYIPAALTGIASVTCLVGGNSVSLRRNAALATAYKLSETALTEYKEKVVETIGEKKEQVIKDKIAKDKVEKNPVSNHEIIITGKGDTLCYDATFGKYFDSDIESIKKSINALNYRLLHEDYVSLNDFYDELGINHIDIGDSVGWNVGRDGMVDVSFSSQIADNGKPCLVLQYCVAPRYEYHKFM